MADGSTPSRPAGFPPDKHGMKLFKRSVSYFIPFKWYVIGSLSAMLVASLCDAGVAWLVKPAMDQIFIDKDYTSLLLIPLAFVGVTLLNAGCTLLQNYLMNFAGLKVLEVLRDEMFRKIIRLPLRFFEKRRTGDLMSHIMNDVALIRDCMPDLVDLVRQGITLVSLMGVVIYQNAQLAFWSFIVLPLVFFPFVYFGRRMRRLGKEGQAKVGDISSLLFEMLSGIRVLKTFTTEEAEGKRFDKENKRLLRLYLKSVLTSECSSGIMDLVGALGIGAVLWLGGSQVLEGTTTPGTFFSFITALVMMYQPIKKLSKTNIRIQRMLAGAERAFGILDDPDIKVEKDGQSDVDLPFRELRFEHVVFSYDESAKALDDVSFTVRTGERIAIVGPSGAGKTTFVNLIPRFYEPQSGSIVLNDKPLAEYTLRSLRSCVSMVSQESFLFNISIRDNIRYGMPSASEEDVVAAAKAAFAHDFIMQTPEGYDTMVGERGVKLSGGQKQRLTIARALLKNAPLLILDEATSALDSESERVVQQALENLMEDRTSIVIAHRLSTIITADRILVMEQGRLVAQGPHASLLQESPLYQKLYKMQFTDKNFTGNENGGAKKSAL